MDVELENDKVKWSEAVDALGWRLFRTNNLENGVWEEVDQIEFTGDEIQADITPGADHEFFRLRRIDTQ